MGRPAARMVRLAVLAAPIVGLALQPASDFAVSAYASAALATFSSPCFTSSNVHQSGSYTVPATGVSTIRAVLYGQNGQPATGPLGTSTAKVGDGSTLVVDVPVTPGEVLQIGTLSGAPGGSGGGTAGTGLTQPGITGGNGGDAEYVSTAGSDGCQHALAVAAGGGGSQGGNADAGSGATGGANGRDNLSWDGAGGGPATATGGGSGGAAGSNAYGVCPNGNAGSWGGFLTGGKGGNGVGATSMASCYPGEGAGGGGAGYYYGGGGGSGYASYASGGGGGGSSYTDPSATIIHERARGDSDGTDPVIVPAYNTTTTIVSATPATPTYGDSATMTAQVTSVGPNQPVTGGTVEFFDRIPSQDGNSYTSVSLGTASVGSAGTASLATTSLSTGQQYLQACFQDTTNSTEGDHASCSDGLYQQWVNAPAQCAPPTTFTAQPADDTTTYGQSAYFSATMSSLSNVQWQVSSDGGTTWTNAPGSSLVENDTPTPGSYFTFDSFNPSVAQSGEKVRVVASTCGGLTVSNSATLTVNPLSTYILANDKSMNAGDSVPPLDVTFAGVVIQNGATPSGMSGSLSCSTTATSSSPIGTYPITCSGLSSPNYVISYLQGTLTVAVGTQTTNFDLSTLPTKTYGDAPFSISSYVSATSGLTVSLSSATPSVCTVAGSTVTIGGAGTCTINADQAGSSDFTAATRVQQSFTVNKKAITVVASANPASQPFGTATAPAVNCTSNGFVGTDTFATAPTGAVYGTVVIEGTTSLRKITVGSLTPIGTYFVKCTGGDPGSNYTISGYTDGTFSVTSAPTTTPLTITANDKSYTYGTTPPTLDVRYGTSNPSLTGTLSCHPYATSDTGHTNPITLSSTTPAGTYTIHCSGLSGSSYSITWADGTLTIRKADLSVAVQIPTKYGDTLPSLTGISAGSPWVTITGLVGTDSATGTVGCTTPDGVTVDGSNHVTAGPGTYRIATCDLSALSAGNNYNAATLDSGTDTSPDSSIVVSRRSIGVTADPQQFTYGGTPPSTYTAQVTDGTLAGGDTLAGLGVTCSATDGQSQPVSASTAAGTYAGAITCAGGNTANYNYTYHAGTLTIDRAPLSITAGGGTMTYGGTVPAISPSYSGWVNGEGASSLTTAPTCGTGATSSSGVGSYASTCSSAADDNYAISYTPGSVTVNPAPLSVSCDNQQKTYGAANPSPLTGTITGVQNSDGINYSCTTAATTTTAAGTAPIVAGVTDPNGKIGNYTLGLTNGTLTINQAASSTGLTSSASPSVSGQSVTFSATVTSAGGTPTGSVTFKDGTTTLGTGALNSSGVATFSTSRLASGAHSITASYGGDHNFVSSSTGSALTQYVDTDISKYLSKGVYNFSKANLSGAYLGNAALSGASFVSANAGKVSFIYATITNANFTSATVAGADFSYANLTGSNFTGTNAGNAVFSHANLTGVNFSGANLKGAAGLKTATLTGVVWSKTMCPDGTNSGSNAGGTCVGHL